LSAEFVWVNQKNGIFPVFPENFGKSALLTHIKTKKNIGNFRLFAFSTYQIARKKVWNLFRSSQIFQKRFKQYRVRGAWRLTKKRDSRTGDLRKCWFGGMSS
jgi:hypothetical protein